MWRASQHTSSSLQTLPDGCTILHFTICLGCFNTGNTAVHDMQESRHSILWHLNYQAVLSYGFLSKAFASAEDSIKSRKMLKGLVCLHNTINSLIFMNINLGSNQPLKCLNFLLEKWTYSLHTHRITQVHVDSTQTTQGDRDIQTNTRTDSLFAIFWQCFVNCNLQLNAAFRTAFQGFSCSAQLFTAEEETKHGQPFLLN